MWFYNYWILYAFFQVPKVIYSHIKVVYFKIRYPQMNYATGAWNLLQSGVLYIDEKKEFLSMELLFFGGGGAMFQATVNYVPTWCNWTLSRTVPVYRQYSRRPLSCRPDSFFTPSDWTRHDCTACRVHQKMAGYRQQWSICVCCFHAFASASVGSGG